MTNENRKYMLQELEARFLPLLLERGFVRHPLSGKDRRSLEMRMAFPFGCMKRPKGDNLELLEVQSDKRGFPEFVINIGVATPQGVTLPWGHIPQDEVGVSGLTEACRLHSKPKSRKWFTLGWFAFDKKARIDKMVDQLIAVYPEVEAWFATRTIGPHLSRFEFPLA